MEQAEEMAKQFTRENITLQENLKEMQVLWFQAESAESYYRQGIFWDPLWCKFFALVKFFRWNPVLRNNSKLI